jgi:hypothetical protein
MLSERDKTLFDLEQRLARISENPTRDALDLLIADEFVEFGVSGKIWRKSTILDAISEWPVIEHVIDDFRVRELSGSLCLVTYRSTRKSEFDELSTSALRSSIWRLQNDQWQIIFHQGTKLP